MELTLVAEVDAFCLFLLKILIHSPWSIWGTYQGIFEVVFLYDSWFLAETYNTQFVPLFMFFTILLGFFV